MVIGQRHIEKWALQRSKLLKHQGFFIIKHFLGRIIKKELNYKNMFYQT